jgi:hypothetical protein
MTPVKTLAYLRLRQWSGSSTNSVKGLVSNCRENSSPAGLQFVIEGVTPRNKRKPICKEMIVFRYEQLHVDITVPVFSKSKQLYYPNSFANETK